MYHFKIEFLGEFDPQSQSYTGAIKSPKLFQKSSKDRNLDISKPMKRERNLGNLSNSPVPETSGSQMTLEKTPGSQRRRHPPLPAQP